MINLLYLLNMLLFLWNDDNNNVNNFYNGIYLFIYVDEFVIDV